MYEVIKCRRYGGICYKNQAFCRLYIDGTSGRCPDMKREWVVIASATNTTQNMEAI